MRQILATTVLVLGLAAPGAAQNADTEEGMNLLEEGAKLFLRGLMEEIEPNMQEFQDLMEEFGPSLQSMMTELGPRLDELLEIVDDFKYYSAPEILPNGDILMRRDPDAPSFSLPNSDGEIEL